MLAVMTGRSTSFLDVDCSTPLPLPVDVSLLSKQLKRPDVEIFRRHPVQESKALGTSSSSSETTRRAPITTASASEQDLGDQGAAVVPSDALFFLCSTQLSILTNTVLNRLFRASTSQQTWAEVQSRIAQLDAQLENWRQGLPLVFDFTKKQQREQQFIRQRLSLGLFYYSTRMIINRPCLCRIDRRIPDESGKARKFNRSAARQCVHAARDLVEMLPDEPNVVGLYRVSPWWSIVHHLVQASTVLMLELSFRAEHMPNEAEEILKVAKKAVSWLRSMSPDNLAARRAWSMCKDILRQVAPKVGRNADDLPDGVSGLATGSTLRHASAFSFDKLSRDPTQPSTIPHRRSRHGQIPQPRVYTAYDELLKDDTVIDSSVPQDGSFFTTTSEMDAILSGRPDDFNSPFADGVDDVDGVDGVDEEEPWTFGENP